MAATATATDSENEPVATCPLCGDYEGAPASVESHVSAKTDDLHKGEVGRAWRDAIHESVEAVDDVVGDLVGHFDQGDDDQEEATEEVADPAVDDEQDDEEEEADDHPEATDEVEVEPVDGVESLSDVDWTMGDRMASVGDEEGMDPATALLIATVLLALVALTPVIINRLSSDGEQASEPAQEPASDDEEEPLEGGLIP